MKQESKMPIKGMLLWSLLFMLLYVIFVAVKWPIFIFEKNINQALAELKLSSKDIGGGILSGQAELITPYDILTARWSVCGIDIFNPVGVCIHAFNDAFDIRFDISAWILISDNSWRIYNVAGEIDIEGALKIAPLPGILSMASANDDVTGKVRLAVDRVTFIKVEELLLVDDWDGSIAVDNLMVSSYNLGNYHAILSMLEEGGNISPLLSVKSSNSLTLMLDASLTLYDNTYSLDSTLRSNNPIITAGLNMFAQSSGKDTYLYKKAGDLPWNK